MILPQEVKDLLKACKEVTVPENRAHLLEMALGGNENKTFDVSFDVNGKTVREANVVRCKNGICANYDDTYMRRRDPDSMVIADDLPTDKITHEARFGKPFEPIRQETFQWLSNQELIVMPFYSGSAPMDLGYPSIVILPKNSAFFAMALADLQGYVELNDIPNFFKPRAVIYVAPPFRHTHYDGKQVVIHNRRYELHEVFSYNLYPGPSAKKGVYSVLLNIGETEKWVTLHASTVKIVTPYELTTVIMHEGASGGGKSEMIEPLHRQPDGRLLLGYNIATEEDVLVSIADSCELYPVTDDMALAHPSIQTDSGKLSVADAEDGWFLRVNHITKYGTEPSTERNTIHPKNPLVFLNIEGVPDSTCLIWEHIMDAPGKPCSNPRVIMPRNLVDNHIDGAVEVDVRSFGLRQPPTTREKPDYGIAGMFHVLPPSLAWLWRLVAPRGFANPSITDTAGMNSEGVGSYWPFATGKRVDQANLLLTQILKTPETRHVLVPNQHIGAYKVGFAGQWVTREFLARRGGAKFRPELLTESRCPLLGYALESVKVDGTVISKSFLQVNLQQEVGDDGYDAGAKMLTDFFKKEVEQYLTNDLLPLGRQIIKACLEDRGVEDYFELIPKL
ncbi:MAG: DUF4914 family protein [Clostridiales bacterium]|jgi:hypothetical protein|nr:DUF4914 family protein [Clostridiales bacterium]